MAKTNVPVGYVKRDLPAIVGKVGLILLAAGLLFALLAFFTDVTRAAFSYLTSYMFIMTIGIGALFLVAIEYLTNADWSVPFRRVSEILASLIPVLLVLTIPLLFLLHNLFHWTHADAVENDIILQGKAPYLNEPFFIIRVVAIVAIWILFYFLLTRNSKKQDVSRDQELTRKNVVLSAVFMPVFAITITLAGVDWMMSLEPHWFSTMFGVYTFAGSVWAALAALTLISVWLVDNKYLHTKINTDHYYSLGTLLFAFTVFWGYIAFSQYMLIWYADLPEETFWFMHRWEGGWMWVSIALIFAHFVVPFAGLLSHRQKTNPKRLKFMSIWILGAHFLDLYWLIMPNMYNTEVGYYFSWMDIVFPIMAVGIIVTVFNFRANKENLVPVGDPKLERGLDFRL
jgi:hypothetical protein